jgi:hypothetical protein
MTAVSAVDRARRLLRLFLMSGGQGRPALHFGDKAVPGREVSVRRSTNNAQTNCLLADTRQSAGEALRETQFMVSSLPP